MTKTTNSTVVFATILGGILLSSGLFVTDAYGAVFAKYDGVDGESNSSDPDDPHHKWIDILQIDWGVHKERANRSQSASSVLDNFQLTMEFEKSTPKLLEKMNLGEVIPKLEIEQTKAVPECPSDIPPEECRNERVTYIKYELKNVQVTSIDVNASGNDEAGPPTVVVGNNFEKVKVTYTEYDSEGNKGGNAETTWKVEKGEK